MFFTDLLRQQGSVHGCIRCRPYFSETKTGSVLRIENVTGDQWRRVDHVRHWDEAAC